MTEEQIKFMCKWLIDNGNRPLSKEEKETIKQTIDKTKKIEELAAAAFDSFNLTGGR